MMSMAAVVVVCVGEPKLNKERQQPNATSVKVRCQRPATSLSSTATTTSSSSGRP